MASHRVSHMGPIVFQWFLKIWYFWKLQVYYPQELHRITQSTYICICLISSLIPGTAPWLTWCFFRTAILMWWITWDFIRMGNYCLEQRRRRVWKSFLRVFAWDDAATVEIRCSKHFCDLFFFWWIIISLKKLLGWKSEKYKSDQIKICQTYWIIPPLLEIPKFQIYPHLMVFYPYMWSTF